MTELSEDEAAIVALVREFVDRDVKPVVRELEHADTYPEELIERMKELGVFGLAIPAPWGDAAVSTPCYAAVTEELARGWMSLAGAMGGHTVVAKLLLAYGTEEQKDRYLPRMATGEVRATMALTEPGGGSDLQAMRTTARRDGDAYVVNGSKTWITNARRSQPGRAAVQDRPGRRPAAPRDQHPAGRARAPASPSPATCPSSATRAWRAASSPSTTSGCRPSALLGGAEGRGFAQMMRGPGDRPDPGRGAGARGRPGRAGGLAARTPRSGRASASRSGSTSRSATYSPTWRPGSTAARQLVLHAARRVRLRGAGRPGGRHGEAVRLGDRDADRAGRGPRCTAATATRTEFDVERYFRDAPLMIVGEGTNEIQRDVIARQLVERGTRWRP